MDSDPQEIFDTLKPLEQKPQIALPDSSIDDDIRNIYQQAHKHRDTLIRFYIWYTALLSLSVVVLIFLQARARLVDGQQKLELIPQWALNLVITGMFGQFIGLLTIVTKRVWEYKPFLDYASRSSKPYSSGDQS